MSDHSNADKWVAIRQAIGSAVFISYVIHYAAYLFVRIKKNRKAVQNVEELSAKMYLVGLAGLLSINYYQTGIFQAIISYLVMLAIIALNGACVLVESVDQKVRCYVFLAFYGLLFAWYLGIIIDYFVTWG